MRRSTFRPREAARPVIDVVILERAAYRTARGGRWVERSVAGNGHEVCKVIDVILVHMAAEPSATRIIDRRPDLAAIVDSPRTACPVEIRVIRDVHVHKRWNGHELAAVSESSRCSPHSFRYFQHLGFGKVECLDGRHPKRLGKVDQIPLGEAAG